jgi:branched-chain amino acid transport system substrate-binding protein
VQAPELVALGGNAVEGLYFTAHFHRAMIDTDLGKELLTRFEKQTGKPLDAFSAMGADAYFIIVDAIKRAGSPDSKKIRNALADTKDFPGVTGKISLKEDGNPTKAMVINKVKGGKFEYVTTVNP